MPRHGRWNKERWSNGKQAVARTEPLEPRRLLSADAVTNFIKIRASDGEEGDQFGIALAVSGNIAIVGTPFDDEIGPNSGSVYLFNLSTGAQLAKLRPSDAAPFDRFGFSLAVSGNIAIIGAPDDDDNGLDSGSAYLFNLSTGAQIAKLKPSDGAEGDEFGRSVGISGNIAVVGARFDDDRGLNSGSAYLFNVSTGAQVAKLVPTESDANDWSGYSVAISGNVVAVGAPNADPTGTQQGSVYLFNATTGQQIRMLRPSDIATFDEFGASVAISGNIVLIGSPRDDDGGNRSGSAYLFNVTTGAQIAKLTASDASEDDLFGEYVALSGNFALIGSTDDSDNGPESGSVYLFNTATGAQLAKIKPVDGTEGDRFGRALAVAGNTVVVSSPGDDEGGSNTGSAYIFTLDTTAPQVASRSFAVEQAQQFTVTFNEPIDPTSLNLAGVTATRLAQGTVFAASAVSWSAGNTVARFTFPALPDGKYRFRLAAGVVKDVAGNSLASAVNYEGPDTYVLAGDANRDQRVDFADLLIVAQNFGQTGRTFSQGNFDYSFDGSVGFSDLLILAQRYGTNLIRVDPRPTIFASRTTARRSPLDADEAALI